MVRELQKDWMERLIRFQSTQYRNSRTGATRRTGTQPDHDVFEGLPVRHWRKKPVGVNLTPDKYDPNTVPLLESGYPELPMPKDAHMLPDASYAILKAARMGLVKKERMDLAEGEKEGGNEEGVEAEDKSGFTAKKWALIPKFLELPEPEYLAKRRKGLPSVYAGISASVGSTVQTKKMKVRRTDAEGKTSVLEVLVSEGQTVDGEIVEDDVSTTQAPAPGTVVEGVGVANAEGVVIAGDPTVPATSRRRPPPPKRKFKGPSRGKRKKVAVARGAENAPFANGGTATNGAGLSGDGKVSVEGQPMAAEGDHGTGEDSIMQDADQDGEEGSEEGSEGEEGDDEDREEGELSLSPSPSRHPARPTAPDVDVPMEEMKEPTPPMPADPIDELIAGIHSEAAFQSTTESPMGSMPALEGKLVSEPTNDLPVESRMEAADPAISEQLSRPSDDFQMDMTPPSFPHQPMETLTETFASFPPPPENAAESHAPKSPALEPFMTLDDAAAPSPPPQQLMTPRDQPRTPTPPQAMLEPVLEPAITSPPPQSMPETLPETPSLPPETEKLPEPSNESPLPTTPSVLHETAKPSNEPAASSPENHGHAANPPEASMAPIPDTLHPISPGERAISPVPEPTASEPPTEPPAPTPPPAISPIPPPAAIPDAPILEPATAMPPIEAPIPQIPEPAFDSSEPVLPPPQVPEPIPRAEAATPPPPSPPHQRFPRPALVDPRPTTFTPKAPTPSPPTPIQDSFPVRSPLSPKAPTMSPPTPIDHDLSTSSPDGLPPTDPPPHRPDPPSPFILDPAQEAPTIPLDGIEPLPAGEGIDVQAAPHVEPTMDAEIPHAHDPLDGLAAPETVEGGDTHGDGDGDGEAVLRFDDGEEDLLGSLERSLAR